MFFKLRIAAPCHTQCLCFVVWGDTVPFIFEWQSSTGSWQIVHGHHGRLLNLAQTRSPTSYFTGVGFFLARIFGEKPEHKKSLKLQMLMKRFASPLCADYIWPPETFTLKSKSWFYLVATTPSKNTMVPTAAPPPPQSFWKNKTINQGLRGFSVIF